MTLLNALKSQAKRHRFLFILLIFSMAILLRTFSAGAEYLPIIDDSVQYISYPSSHDYGRLIREEGLFASRPMAAIMDLFFVGQMNEALIVPALLIGLMHALAGMLYWRLFDRIFGGISLAFPTFYALLPLGVEGTFWISASARIVPGLLFAAIAANLLERFISRGKWWNAAWFPIAALLSYGFYEPILALSFALSTLILLKNIKNRRSWLAFSTIPLVIFYFIFTGLHASDGALGSRMEIVFPNSPWYYDTFLPDISRQMGAAFIKGGFRTLFVGFVRGISICASSFGGVLCIIGALAVGGLILLAAPHSMTKNVRPQAALWVWGILLFLAPLAPYFVIANPWFSLRATVPSFVGAGLIADALLRVITRRERILSVATAILAVMCLVAGFSEVADYHAVGEYDEVLCDAIIEVADEFSGRVGLIGVEERPLPGNYSYHEHVASVGVAEWSLYSKLVVKCGAMADEFHVVPLAVENDNYYAAWNRDAKHLSGFEQIWLWDDTAMTLTKMDVTEYAPDDFGVYYPDGTRWAHIFEYEGIGCVFIDGPAEN